jgi:uncharacterized integral membrane protein
MLKYLVVAVLASAVTVFALQNNAPVAVQFLVWSLDSVPLATVILVSFAAGVLGVGVPLWIDRWRLRSRANALERRLTAARAASERPAPPATPPVH